VHHLADQAPGVEAVVLLGDGPDGAGGAQPAGDELPHLARARRDEPDLVAPVQVPLEQPACTGEHLGLEHLVVDVLRHRDHLGDRVALDDAEGPVARVDDLLAVLAGEEVPDRVAGEHHDVGEGEELPPVQFAGDVVGAGAADDRVVDVEERRRARAGGRQRVGGAGGLLLRGRHGGHPSRRA